MDNINETGAVQEESIVPSNVVEMKEYLVNKGMTDEEADETIQANPLEEADKKIDSLFEEGQEGVLTEQNMQRINELLKNSSNYLKMMEDNWRVSEKTYHLKDEHMKRLHAFNMAHRKEKPEDTPEDEWDYMNGLTELTDEEIIDIFGEDNPIIGPFHDITIDRIKDVADDFFNWINALKEYNGLQSSYMELIEINEEREIEKLKVYMEKEEDPNKKATMKKSIDEYYSNKYMDFLHEELSPTDRTFLINTFGDNQKCAYLINRCRDKMAKLKINSKFILEISQFEKRFLPEKYHDCSNMLLLYFMKYVTYSNVNDKNDASRFRVYAMVTCLDNVIRDIFNDEQKQRVLGNIMTFLDQVIDEVVEKYRDRFNKK